MNIEEGDAQVGDLRQARGKQSGKRSSARGQTAETESDGGPCAVIPESCCAGNRCQVLGGCLAVSAVCDAVSMWQLQSGQLVSFGIIFLISVIANVTIMFVFFGPRKYVTGLFTRKRVVTTVLFYGLTVLTIALCFGHGVEPIAVIFCFIAQQIAWAFNMAAGFGCTPCALPEKKEGD